MKKRNLLLTATTLLTASLLFTGCQNEPVETAPTFYNAGTYAPEDCTYVLDLPSDKWTILEDENPENITFVYNKSKVSVKRHNIMHRKYKERILKTIASIPTEQSELEEELKANNIRQYSIDTFKHNVYYDENYDLTTTNYVYFNDATNTYKAYYSVVANNYLYELEASTTSSETMNEIKTSLNNFALTLNKEPVKVFALKEKTISGNVYNSLYSDFALVLPYGDWQFVPGDTFTEGPYTTITTDSITIDIEKQSQFDLSNIIVYEIPDTLEILNKQIEMKNLGEYELLDYKVKTVGTLPEIDEKQNFTTFSYLLKCNANNEMKYYVYAEFRTENTTYKITGKLTQDNLDKANELNQILKSFYTTSNY